MNPQMKNALSATVIVVLLIFALSAISFAFTYSRSLGPLTLRNFTVDGEGEAVAVPGRNRRA